MSRGPRIKPEEIKEAKRLKAEGNKLEVIAMIMKRTLPSIRKMLRSEIKTDD